MTTSPGTATAVGTVTVRYFAAAAEAAGLDSEAVAAGTADEVVAELTRRHGDGLAAVLTRCSLLADGTRVEGADPVRAGATLDVLPPFAGG